MSSHLRMNAALPRCSVTEMSSRSLPMHAEAKEHLELLVRAVTQSAPLPHGMPAVQAIMRTICMCIAPSLMYTARTVPPEIIRQPVPRPLPEALGWSSEV